MSRFYIPALIALFTLTACSTPQRPPLRAVPTETLKVSPELLKSAEEVNTAPVVEAPAAPVAAEPTPAKKTQSKYVRPSSKREAK